MRNKLTILIPLIVFVTSLIGLYFWIFHNGLSNSQSDWAAFGGYVGGIATVINIGVFVWLTLSIQESSDIKNDRNHHLQIKLALSRIREERLKLLNEAFGNVRRCIHDRGKLAIAMRDAGRIIDENMQCSIFFTFDNGTPLLDDVINEYNLLFKKISASNDIKEHDYEILIDKIMKETFKISQAVEISIVGQLHRNEPDGVCIFLNDKLTEMKNC